jgi:hypothetical protein
VKTLTEVLEKLEPELPDLIIEAFQGVANAMLLEAGEQAVGIIVVPKRLYGLLVETLDGHHPTLDPDPTRGRQYR